MNNLERQIDLIVEFLDDNFCDCNDPECHRPHVDMHRLKNGIKKLRDDAARIRAGAEKAPR